MPLWTPQFTDLPQTGGAQPKRYVDQNSWNALLDNFANWKDNVNAGGKNLSNLGVVTITGGSFGNPAVSMSAGGQYCLFGDRGVVQSWPNEGLTGTYMVHNAAHYGGVGWKAIFSAGVSAIKVGTGYISFHVDNSATAGSDTPLQEIVRITPGGGLGVNCTPLTAFHARVATDVNLMISGAVSLPAGSVSINATNNANSANIPLEIRGSVVGFTLGRVRIPLPAYANNAAAIAGGLAAGDLYMATSGDPRAIYVVV